MNAHCPASLFLFQCCGAGDGGAVPKFFEIWSRNRNCLLNKYLLQSIWRMLGCGKNLHLDIFLMVLLLYYSFKWQYVLEPEPKLGIKVEPEPKINNFDSATPFYFLLLNPL